MNESLLNFSHSQKAALGLCLTVAALTGITFIYSALQWRDDWLLTRGHPTKAPVIVKSTSSSELAAAPPGDHLFGKSLTKLGDMPITNLQLQVTGIVKVDNSRAGQVSKAYISIAGQPSKIFQVGDKLPYGVKIYEITADAIVLENNGHFEKLPLPRERLQFKPRQIVERTLHD
ncbi:type II secretion system protein N [Aquicella siphonis]|uniref:type II secretion system protein N n=1 Tax=Aquicella siphonis TaxID=254247 RepID=UPI00155A94E2|nr:type II secretion system protein N [Aquicella siphonis]